MPLMFEVGIRRGICQSIHRYAKANNKYMKNYDENKASSYLLYLDANNLYGWTKCKKLSVGNFKWADDLSKYTKDFIKNYDEDSDYGSILEVNIDYPKTLWRLHKDLPFLTERRKLGNTEKLITSIDDKENYVIHIGALKHVTNRRDIKLVTTNERRNKLVSEPSYHSTEHFLENVLAIEMRKTKIIMNKPVYLGQAILDISKTLKYQFWYDYIKPKYKEKVQLCYMDTDSFIIHIFTENFYKGIAKDVKKWFDTSGYDKNDNRPLPIGINKKVIGKFKDELNGKIMKELCVPRDKTYPFKLDNETEKKKA